MDSPDGVAPGIKAHFEQLASFQVPLDEDSLLLESYGFFYAGFPPALKSAISGIGAYDLDPHLAKRAVQITGRNELEDSGSNLAIVLSRLLEDETQRKRFDRLVADFLPFVSGIGVDRIADRSLLFHMSETYAPEIELPASLLSAGTINIIAILIALHFESRSLVLIEEPGRSLHPRLMSRMMNHLVDASDARQVIITTHNPELVRHAPPQDLILMKRDERGFSSVVRPADREAVQTFVRNEIGIEDLFVQDLLGV